MSDEFGHREAILRRPGNEWNDDKLDAVYEWVCRKQRERLVALAFRMISGRAPNIPENDRLIEAEQVADNKIVETCARTRMTYAPARYRFFESPHSDRGHRAFMNWLQTIVARAAVERGKQLNPASVPELPPCDRTVTWRDVEAVWDRLTPTEQRVLLLCRDAFDFPPRDRRRGDVYRRAAERAEPPCSAGAMRLAFFRACRHVLTLLNQVDG